MPDSFAASAEVLVRTAKNRIIRLNVVPQPNPIKVMNNGASALEPNHIPPKPNKKREADPAVRYFWLWVLAAIRGMTNEPTMPAICISDNIQPALSRVIPRSWRISGSQEMPT
ncbi:hypothetical protein D3C81_881580 [compost metagenome]